MLSYNRIGMISLNIFIKFFRDFLDGWIYVVYVMICLLLIFLCVRSLFKKRKKLIAISDSINVSDVATNISTNSSTNYVDSIIQTSNDSGFRYSGDIIDDKK